MGKRKKSSEEERPWKKAPEKSPPEIKSQGKKAPRKKLQNSIFTLICILMCAIIEIEWKGIT